MNDFDFYIHGVPTGHEVTGSDAESRYYLKFYEGSQDFSKEKGCLLVEYVQNKSYYTYLYNDCVQNQQGREGSYFAITLSFKGRYCTNVEMLYRLLKTIFEQVCLKSFFENLKGTLRFKVATLNEAVFGDVKASDAVRSGINKNFGNLNLVRITDGKEIKDSRFRISIKDIDSPYFFDLLSKYSVIVLPEMKSFKELYDQKCKELIPLQQEKSDLQTKCKEYSKEVQKLKEQCSNLNKTIEEQETKLSEKEDSIKKAKTENSKNLERIKKENNDLKAAISQIENSAKEVEQSTSKLLRQLADRFPKDDKENYHVYTSQNSSNREKHSNLFWVTICNTILLLFIGGLSLYHICSSDKIKKETVEKNENTEDVPRDFVENDRLINGDTLAIQNGLLTDNQLKEYREKTRIDIPNLVGGEKTLDPDKIYSLKMDWKDIKPIEEDGTWRCESSAVEIIDKNNISIKKNKLKKDTTVIKIQYVVQDQVIKERSISIVK